jgi:Arc/MetJ family transcription regulator
MKTTLHIDDHLLAEARRLTKIEETAALVRAGLEALIACASARRLAALAASEPELTHTGRRRTRRGNPRK